MTSGRKWMGALVAAGLLAGVGCATDQSREVRDPPPPIMEPGIGGAGQSGIPVEQIPQGTGQPEDEVRPPAPSEPAPVSPGAPPEPPPPGPPPPGPGPGPEAKAKPAVKPDVVQSPAGGETDTPFGERRSGEDASPANIRTLED